MQALNRKKAGVLRQSLERARSSSPDLDDGDLDKMTQKVFYYGIIAYCYWDILIFLACSRTKVWYHGQFLDEK